jgi:hypothetical protein
MDEAPVIDEADCHRLMNIASEEHEGNERKPLGAASATV